MRRKKATIVLLILTSCLWLPASVVLAKPELSGPPSPDHAPFTILSAVGEGHDGGQALTWYSSSWLYRKKITIDHTRVAGDLSDFPVLISLASDADLRDKAQDDGDDILFTQSDGQTKLDHEIEAFDPASGRLVAWVRIPWLSSSTDTEIYLYYGNPHSSNQQNPAGVWDSSFKMVQHLKDATDSTTEDSTINGNDGSKSAANNPAEVDAKIGKGQDFSQDYINCGDLGIGNAYTAECWMKADTLSGTGDQDTYGFTLMASSATAGYYPLWLTVRQTEVRLWAYESSATGYRETTGAGLTTGSYFYIAATAVKGSTTRVYVNGVERLSFSNDGEVDWTSIFTMGDLRPGRAIYFDGIIDEVRISSVARSASWIQTCYNNQNSPSSFYTVSTEESPVQVTLTGWGWCPQEQKGIGDAVFTAFLFVTPRAEPEVSDVGFIGTLNLTYPDGTTRSFDLDLWGVKTRSLFYLGQHEVDPASGAVEWEAAFLGTWLTWEPDGQYIDCSGSVLLMPGEDWLKTTKPYFFALRMPDVEIPQPQLPAAGNYTQNMQYLIELATLRLNELLTSLSRTNFFEVLGDLLDRVVVIIKEVRNGIGGYIP